MRFRFRNIGPIDNAELELGDLTLIAGRNNTGKTYIVYTLYGFLRNWRNLVTRRFSPRQRQMLLVAGRRLREGLAKHPEAPASIPRDEMEQIRDQTLKDATKWFSRTGIASVFSSPSEAFADATFSAKPTEDLPPSGHTRRFPLASGLEATVTYGSKSVDFVLDAGNDDTRAVVSDLLLRAALPDMPTPFILSAERFGISLFYKELDFTKNRLVEMLQQLGDDKESRRQDMPYVFLDRAASRYALPVKDNIDYTRSIPQARNEQSDLYDQRLYDHIKDLMDGYYTASADDIRFRSKSRKGRTFNIPLHLASSSARGLSDLYFYSRHEASENQLLMVDEPESHLDTANQLLLARVLAHFVRAGIKVLVTTHSDYLIKEINNLVMLGQLDASRRRKFIRGLDYRGDEWLARDSLRAYVAEDNHLTACPIDQFGVDMPVFDKTIDDVNRVANELAAAISE